MFKSLDPLYQDAFFDSAAAQAAEQLQNDDSDIDTSALNAEIQNLRKAALITVFLLSEAIIDKQLGEDELPSDRLDALLAGFATEDEDDEGIEVDQSTLDIFIATVQDALASLGVSSDVIDAMFGEGEEAETAIESAAEIVESNTPTGDDLQEFSDLFVYGETDEGEQPDDTILDAASIGKTTVKKGKFGRIIYKAVKAIRNGKVKIVNKRIAGKVKLSAQQKQALNKARRKAVTSTAVKKRMKSLKKRRDLAL